MGGLPTSWTVNGFAVNPEDSRVMYVAMRDGLFQSMDVGESWRPVGKGLTGLAAVAINPRQANEVFAVSVDGKVYRTADGGKTWEPQR